jgi:hypothetical protein
MVSDDYKEYLGFILGAILIPNVLFFIYGFLAQISINWGIVSYIIMLWILFSFIVRLFRIAKEEVNAEKRVKLNIIK